MMSFWKRFSYNRGAVIGLVINIVSALLLGHDHSHGAGDAHGHAHADNNMRAAYIHVLTHAYGGEKAPHLVAVAE